MVAYTRVSAAERDVIKLAIEAGISTKSLAKRLKRSSGTIRTWKKRGGKALEIHKTTPPPVKKSTRRAVNARRKEVLALVGQTKMVKHRKFPAFSSTKAIRDYLQQKKQINVSRETVRHDLLALGCQSKARPKRVATQPGEFKARLAFAKKHQRQSAAKMVFTDEKTFTCGDYSSRSMWVEPGKEALPRDGSSTLQDSVYVWGAIGIGYKKLVVLRTVKQSERVRRCQTGEKKSAFDGGVYIRKCIGGGLANKCVADGLTLQADNHRVHYSKQVVKYCDDKQLRLTRDWPARSPDLNPIENLWAALQHRVSMHVPLNATELEKWVRHEWAQFDQAAIDKYVMSFRGKCRRVVKAKGKMTS